MENKNKNGSFNYLQVVLLLTVAVVAGLFFSSMRNGGSANVVGMDAAGGQANYTCADIKAKLATGGYTADEKAWYAQNCEQQDPAAPQYTCDQAAEDIASGAYTSDEKSWYSQNCDQNPPATSQYSCDQLNGYKDSKGLTTDEQAYYDKYCKDTTSTTTEGGCSPAAAGSQCQQPVADFCSKFKSLLEQGGTYTADEKAMYLKLCVNDNPVVDVCVQLKDAMASGKYTDAEKEQYLKLCVQPTPPQTDPTDDPCGYLKDLMAKYSTDPTSADYVNAKNKYDLYCAQTQPGTTESGANVCSDLKVKLDTLIKNGQTDTDEYTKTKLSYTALCTEFSPTTDRCAELKTKLETYIKNNDTSSNDYASVKTEYLNSCQKPVPPAGFEDQVLTSFNQKDCPFSDLKISDLCGKASMELYRRGVIGGFADGTFKGNDPVNRAQAAKFLLLAKFGIVSDTTGSSSVTLSDVEHGSWYERFVARASGLGVITGYSDHTFRPANGVNTAEFLKMMTLTFNLDTGLTYDYTDVQASDWFAQYAGIAQKYSLFPDNTTGKLDPGHKMTRCEVAIAIYEYLLHR